MFVSETDKILFCRTFVLVIKYIMNSRIVIIWIVWILKINSALNSNSSNINDFKF